MKIDLSTPEPTIDAADLARAMNMDAAQVQSLMRSGAITSRFETGVGEDAGTYRLTFWHGDLKVRFTCDETGHVLKTSRVTAGPRR